MKTGYLVTCIIIRRLGQATEFLQLKRSEGRYMAGTWQFVAGGIDEGETATAAMLREIGEETGLSPLEFYQLDVVSTFFIAKLDTLFHSPMFCAVVAADAEVRLNEEHTDYRWVAEAEIVSRAMWPGERSALAELKREILNDGPAKAYLRIN